MLINKLGKNLRQDSPEFKKLAEVIGDMPAAELSKLLTAQQQYQQQFKDNLTESVKDYCQEELRWLPTRPEFDNFSQQVQELQQELEQLKQDLAKKA